jgi:PAS domain S-box-containing protein
VSEGDQRRRAMLPTGAFVVSLALIPVFLLLDKPAPMKLTLQIGALIAGLCFAVRVWMLNQAELRITAALRRSQEDLDRFFVLTPDMLCIADESGRFVRVNPYFERILGHSAEELTSRPFFDFVHPDDVAKTAEQMAGLNAGLETVSFENRYRCRSGEYLTVMWNSTPDRETGLIYAAARDITDLRRTEQELDRFFTLTPDMLAVLDLEGHLLRVNPFFAEKLGYAQEELAGRSFTDFVHPEDVESTSAEAGRADLGEASATFENRYRRRDGSFITLLWSSAAVPEHGVVYAAARDVTELRRSTEEIRHLYDNAPCGFHSTRVDGAVTHVNATELSWLGRNADDLLGRSFTDVLTQTSALAYQRSLVEVEQRGMAEVDCELVSSAGVELQVLVKSVAILDDSERFAGAYSTVIDMTERRRTEDALTEARDRALAASQLKSDFVANMSHEIRTPLNGVVGMTDLILETPLAGEQRLYAEAILASGNALMSVIGDILDFSKIEAGKLELDHQAFALHETVESGCALVAGLANAKDLELMTSIDEQVPAGVTGDPTRLRQVIVNLVSNAVKFTAEGEVLVRVDAQPGEDDTVRVRFEVSDTGIGIAPDALDVLFEPFVQADASTTREYGGTGLGLAISKQLVESMGGRDGSREHPGRGQPLLVHGALRPRPQPAPRLRPGRSLRAPGPPRRRQPDEPDDPRAPDRHVGDGVRHRDGREGGARPGRGRSARRPTLRPGPARLQHARVQRGRPHPRAPGPSAPAFHTYPHPHLLRRALRDDLERCRRRGEQARPSSRALRRHRRGDQRAARVVRR